MNSLDPKLRAIARELVAWREETAPRRTARSPRCSPTPALIEVAKRRPSEMRQLEQIRGINESTLRRRGRAILEAVERGRSRPPIPVEGERPAQPDALDAPVIALAEALVRTRALEEELAYELIAARADLQRIVLAMRDGAPAAGGPHAAGLAPRGRRRRAARAAGRQAGADRRARPARRRRRAADAPAVCSSGG